MDDGGAYVGLCSSDVVFVPTGLGTGIRALEWLCRGGGGNCSGSSGQRERDGEKIAVHETCLSWVSFLVPGEIVAAPVFAPDFGERRCSAATPRFLHAARMRAGVEGGDDGDRKSTRLNSSH